MIQQKPRVMMLIHNFRPGTVGGAEIQAERLACKLVECGHYVQVLTMQTASNAPLQENINGVHIHRTPFHLAYWVKSGGVDTFRFLVTHRHSYDVLHCHMAYGHAMVAIMVARCFRKKCLVKIACAGEFGDLYGLSKFENAHWGFEILHQADMMIAVSREVEDELSQYGFAPRKIMRIPNGVDIEYFKRTQAFPPRERVTFILTGRRHPQKGIDILLHAIKLLIRDGKESNFIVRFYGTDYPEHDYRQMAATLGVAGVVEFLPFNQDMLSVYHDAHCFLLPSRGEGLSNALLEAMSMELPVITTPVSGMRDVVVHNDNGFLVPSESPEALANAMSMIIESPGTALRLGQNARHKIEQQFSIRYIAEEYSKLYQLLCSPSRRIPSFNKRKP